MRLSWLKLDAGILDDQKIKIIRKMPAGSDLFLIWIGLMCLAMKTSQEPGTIQIDDGIPYTPEDLANHFDLSQKTVSLALETFRRLKMVEINEMGIIELINFRKHQSIDRIEAQRERVRLNMKKMRERRKNPQIAGPVIDKKSPGDQAVIEGVIDNSVTGDRVDLDLDLDKEIDKEKEKKGAPLEGGALLLKIIIDLRKGGEHGGIPPVSKTGKFTAAHARLYGKNAKFQLEAIAEADGTELAGRVFRWGAEDKFWGGHELHAGIYERLKAGYLHSQRAAVDPLIASMKESAELLGGRK